MYLKPTNSVRHLVLTGKPGCRKVRLTALFRGGQKQTTKVSIKALRRALNSGNPVTAINDGSLLEVKRYKRTLETGVVESLVSLRFKPVEEADLVTVRYTDLRDALTAIKRGQKVRSM